MKKFIVLVLCAAISMAATVCVGAAELNKNEADIIKKITSKSYPKVETRYVNQFRNYFLQDGVSIEKKDANTFVDNLEEALCAKRLLDAKGLNAEGFSKTFQYYEKAATSIGLLLEYDSAVEDYYWVDELGYIVIDQQSIIKDTDKKKNNNSSNSSDSGEGENSSWNFSIDIVFAAVLILCIAGILMNIRRIRKSLRKHEEKNYDDEADDELEVANRRTRKNRLQTFSYKSVKQGLKYFYIPIIMGLILVGAVYGLSRTQSDLIDSVKRTFINRQPIYQDDHPAEDIKPIKKQKKTIDASKVTYPKFSEQLGDLKCDKLKLKTVVYYGDRYNILNKGAGMYCGSTYPGNKGQTIIGGHDTTNFKKLKKVKKGMKFTLETKYATYKYKVTKVKVYKANKIDEAYSLGSDKEQLVLYTCYPFEKWKGDKSERMFVYLDRIDGPSVEQEV